MFSIVTTPLIILTIEHILHLLKWFQNRFFHCVYICWINDSLNLPSHCLGIKANCITFYLFLLWVFTNLWPITSSSLQISIPGPLPHAPITPLSCSLELSRFYRSQILDFLSSIDMILQRVTATDFQGHPLDLSMIISYNCSIILLLLISSSLKPP